MRVSKTESVESIQDHLQIAATGHAVLSCIGRPLPGPEIIPIASIPKVLGSPDGALNAWAWHPLEDEGIDLQVEHVLDLVVGHHLQELRLARIDLRT